MISSIRQPINNLVEKAVKPYARFLNPNLITLSSLLVTGLTCFLYIQGLYLWAALSLPLQLVDLIDGSVAKAGNKITAFGGFLDATIDRIAESLIYISIGLSGSARWEICSFVIFITLLVSYVKAKAEGSLGITKIGTNQLSIGFLAERAERPIVFGLFSFLYFFSPKYYGEFNLMEYGLLLVIIFSFITVLMRMHKAYQLMND